jgi:hypothetical protein
MVPSLGGEIARAKPKVKKLDEAAVIALNERWTEELGDSNLAWEVICQLIGTVVVAREVVPVRNGGSRQRDPNTVGPCGCRNISGAAARQG